MIEKIDVENLGYVTGGWVAQIRNKGKTLHLGWFKKKEEAVKARLEGEKTYKYITHKQHD